MLLGARHIAIIRDLPLHVFVEASETVTKRGILDPLLIGDDIVVERLEAGDRVDDEVTVAGDGADRVGEQGDVHDRRQLDEGLQVLPLADIVVVQVEELQAQQAFEDRRRRQGLQLIVGQINFLEVLEGHQVGQILKVQQVAL